VVVGNKEGQVETWVLTGQCGCAECGLSRNLDLKRFWRWRRTVHGPAAYLGEGACDYSTPAIIMAACA